MLKTNTEDTKNFPKFHAGGLPTLIGSLPLADYQEALKWIFDHTPEIPLWPQLPSNTKEGMLNQFIEGFPGIVESEERTYFDQGGSDFEENILKFYEEYLLVTEDPTRLSSSRFSVSPERAGGLYRLVEEGKNKTGMAAIKGQMTGPFTLLTGLTDKDRRLAYYDPSLKEMAVKGLAMKGAWQIRTLKELGLPVLLFIDEPALAGLGSSAFISIAKEDIAQDLAEVIASIHQAGGQAGIHVCANTDWNLILSLAIDIISFDAYSFFDRFVLCMEQAEAFLARGGIIAWGLVPTSEKEHIKKETAESLVALWETQAAQLAGPNRDLSALLAQTLITPSCGTGSLPPDLALRVLQLCRDVSRTLRDKYS